MASFDCGRYLCRTNRVELGEAKTGTAQIVIKFTPLGMIDPQDPEGELLKCPDWERAIFRAVTEKTMPWVTKDLAVLHYTHDSFRYLSPEDPQYDPLGGIDFEAVCEHEVYEGKQRERWQMAHGGSVQVKPLDTKSVRKLDALFGKQLKEAKVAKSNGKDTPYSEAVKPEPQHTNTGPGGQDDIPFMWLLPFLLIPFIA